MRFYALLSGLFTAVGIRERNFDNCTHFQRQLMSDALTDARRVSQLTVDVVLKNMSSIGLLHSTDLQILRRRYFGNVSEEDNDYIQHVFTNLHSAFDQTSYVCATPDHRDYVQSCHLHHARAFVRRDGTPEVVSLCPVIFDWILSGSYFTPPSIIEKEGSWAQPLIR